MAFNVYDPASVTITLGGHSVTGFADGSFVSVSQTENSFEVQVGSDGETVRSRSNNRSGTVTITLVHTSASNDFLRSLHSLDIAARSREVGINSEGAGIRSFQIKDLNGNTLISANSTWISKYPDVEFDRESTSREWELTTDKLVFEGL